MVLVFQHISEQGAAARSAGLRLLLAALALTVVFHGGLLPFTHGNTYDAFIHMFFADHYHRSWFDPWEPRWYTGFSVTSYPPGTHMAIATLMWLVPMRAAYVLVQLVGLILLVCGVFRFSLLWVPPRAAGLAALAAVLASSVSQTVHLFGQLPTIFSLGVFLNGLPHVYRWIARGGLRHAAAATLFAAATTAAHHVTTIFGGVLFILPLAILALVNVATGADGVAGGAGRAGAGQGGAGTARSGLARLAGLGRVLARPLLRGLFLAVCMVGAIVVTVYAYWHWSVTDPITQVAIPHGSRESFAERPDLGIVFLVLPWGVAILFLPYALYKGLTTRLWPLALSLLLCAVLGTGGTTALPRMLLGGAFDILTLDRFTFWATILILPFLGLLAEGLLHGRARRLLEEALGPLAHRLTLGALLCLVTGAAVLPAVLPRLQPTQPAPIDPAPILRFLSEDEHGRWRYLTLGFGDQFAFVSAQTTALSIDGNYHSARRLPDLTRFSVERLENAKYLGVPGLGSLRQFLVNAERHHLKYVFSNDEFYSPLLHFSGWTRLNRLANGVVVWEKPDVPPLPQVLPRREIPSLHALMWGVLPPGALVLAGLMLAASARGGPGRWPGEGRGMPVSRPAHRNPARVRALVLVLGAGALILGLALGGVLRQRMARALSPEEVITAYFEDLDFRRHEEAYARLDPATRGPLDHVLFGWRWTGGLVASFGKLDGIDITPLGRKGAIADFAVRLDWITALDLHSQRLRLRLVEREGVWFIAPTVLRPVQTPLLLQRQEDLAVHVVGRRQPRPETDLHRDRLDRPRIQVWGGRLVRHGSRYSVVGQITNADADPAHVTIKADLSGARRRLGSEMAGLVHAHRLLPAETAGFRIDFEGVLSLQDARAGGAFDPRLFVPPEFAEAPRSAGIEARALVTAEGLYRGIALNGVRTAVEGQALIVTGQAVNTGTQTASIVGLNLLAYGPDGRPLWAEASYVESNIHPGQSAGFRVALPLGSAVQPIAEIGAGITANGRGPQADLSQVGAGIGTLPLDRASGYSHLRILATTMTFDPLF